jgi:hypothetical protein
MDARSRSDARLTALWPVRCPHVRCDRRRRQIGPVVEDLEGRLLLAGASQTNPLPAIAQPAETASPQQLGAAYQQVVAIQTATLQSLGNSYREVQAAGVQFARKAAAAIDELNADLTNAKSRHEAGVIVTAIARDRHLLNQGGADVARVEEGLDVARGLADQQASTDKIYIPNGLYTNLATLVQQDRSTGAAISRSGRRSTNALVRQLGRLGDRLTSSIPGLGDTRGTDDPGRPQAGPPAASGVPDPSL